MKLVSLRDSLEIYDTKKSEDGGLMDTICKKVSKDYVAGGTNCYKINKIVESFDDFNYVMMKFEGENEAILDDIKRYIMGCSFDSTKVNVIEAKMEEWALFFQGIGIEPTLLKPLINRYRENFITQYSTQVKSQLQPLIYLEYLLLIRDLSIATHAEQINILEEFKVKDEMSINLLCDYIISSGNGNIFTNKLINVSKIYVEKLTDERFLLNTIKDIFNSFAQQYNYNDYKEDLKKIYLVQGEIKNSVDINKLTNLISLEKLEILKELHLVEEINEDYTHIIKLTEIAFSMIINKFLESWENDNYFYENDNLVLIPFNSNPLRICKYLFNKNYILKERDFLIIFERKK